MAAFFLAGAVGLLFNLAIFIAAGVILCSLLLASFLLPLMARGIPLEKEDQIAHEEGLARKTAAEAAVARIEELVDQRRNDIALYEARQAAALHHTDLPPSAACR